MGKQEIILEPEEFERLGAILELAQSHTDEEITHSDVVRELINLAYNHIYLSPEMLGKLVYEETTL